MTAIGSSENREPKSQAFIKCRLCTAKHFTDCVARWLARADGYISRNPAGWLLNTNVTKGDVTPFYNSNESYQKQR